MTLFIGLIVKIVFYFNSFEYANDFTKKHVLVFKLNYFKCSSKINQEFSRKVFRVDNKENFLILKSL